MFNFFLVLGQERSLFSSAQLWEFRLLHLLERYPGITPGHLTWIASLQSHLLSLVCWPSTMRFLQLMYHFEIYWSATRLNFRSSVVINLYVWPLETLIAISASCLHFLIHIIWEGIHRKKIVCLQFLGRYAGGVLLMNLAIRIEEIIHS